MKIIRGEEFDAYWKKEKRKSGDSGTYGKVESIIEEVRAKGDAAVRKFAAKFDKSSPAQLEVSVTEAKRALDDLQANDPELADALRLAAKNIMRFSQKQKEQYVNFEYEMADGVITGQKIIPVQCAGIYIPSGRFPLFSSVLMCMIPAFCAGVDEVLLSSPPGENSLPDRKILAAAAIAADTAGVTENNRLRIFSVGGAQAIAALALGTESIPSADIIIGPGNKYVAAAKNILFGEVGIDFIAGPSDILIISDPQSSQVNSESNIDGLKENEIGANLVASDMLAQAEHDPDARARALVPTRVFADKINSVIERKILALPTKKIARSSINSGGVIIVYKNKEEAVHIANTIAPEHLELHLNDAEKWIPLLKNYGSLFNGQLSAEALGDYSAGLNHTLPTSGCARYTGGLSVQNFLKIVTTLNCSPGQGFEKVRMAAETIGRAEGLEGHAQSAAMRK